MDTEKTKVWISELDTMLAEEFGVGRRPIMDTFFNDSYVCCRLLRREGVTVEDEEQLCHKILKPFDCNACTATFDNIFDYQLHYNDLHHLVCAECKKKCATARLLDIHIQETHDSFFQVMAEKQPMYQCFVSHCDVKFKDPLERRSHCQEVHMFSKYYRYDESKKMESKTKDGQEEPPMETDLTESETQKKKIIHLGKNLPKAFSKETIEIKKPATSTTDDPKSEKKLEPVTMFVPTQVQQKSFAKVLTENKTMETDVLESESIMDLADSLPSIK